MRKAALTSATGLTGRNLRHAFNPKAPINGLEKAISNY